LSARVRAAARIVKADARLQIAWGVVLEPRTASDPDSQGDWYDETDVRKAAHGFMANLAAGRAGSTLMHEGDSIGRVVESFIAPMDMQLGDELVKAGSWVAGIHYSDSAVWSEVEKGALGAFSIGGHGTRS
jgi:hypothetical protein